MGKAEQTAMKTMNTQELKLAMESHYQAFLEEPDRRTLRAHQAHLRVLESAYLDSYVADFRRAVSRASVRRVLIQR